MSLIFEALKKGTAPAGSVSQAPAPVMPEPIARAAVQTQPLGGLILAVLSGMLLAGGGAWLYWAGRTSGTAATVAVQPQAAATVPAITAATAPAPAPTLAAAPVSAPSPAPAATKVLVESNKVLPKSARVETALAIKSLAAASAPKAVVKPIAIAPATQAATPALKAASASALPSLPVAEVKPAPRVVPNTQVQVSVEPAPVDVREVFQQFVQQLQMGQLVEAQTSADKISGAMGRSHVMSLRAQGYLALKKGDLGLARQQYVQLHQMLPDDREAGLNLALVEWRQGDKDSAAKRVAHLLEKFPNDQEIQALYLNVRNP